MSVEEIRARCRSDDEAAHKAERVEQFREAAASSGRSLAHHALRFVSQLEGVSVTLIGISRHHQLTTLLANGII
jgi:aryl-alcohol dehydrogenase-like predicted oxidoreductase